MSLDSQPLSPDLDDSKFDKYGDLRDMSEDLSGEVRHTMLLLIYLFLLITKRKYRIYDVSLYRHNGKSYMG